MEKTLENLMNEIDSMSYEDLLRRWRFAKIGDPIFQGESGSYFRREMIEKGENVNTSAVSKRIGWN